jgi:polysaccharide deacetylase 2 family uncharacterized protein YibQ
LKDVSPAKPKLIEAEPTMKEFIPNLKAAADVADRVGVNNAQAILDEAKRYSAVDAQQRQIEDIAKRQGLTGY